MLTKSGHVFNEIDQREYVAICITPETLSDRSVAFNVRCGSLNLAAYSETDANELATKIAEAIKQHTTEDAEVIDESFLR